tara:strand:- start:1122 stop:1724 length:603 start_codon:yes stop_codon:yes gene_type:complete
MSSNANSLMLRARYLSEERGELKSAFDSYYVEFFNIINNELESGSDKKEDDVTVDIAQREAADPTNEDSVDEKSKDSLILKSKDLKKIYKKIMNISHPDKHPDYFKKEDTDRMLNIYRQCVSAIENDNIYLFLDCASKLYIDLPEIDENIISDLRALCTEMENDIKNIKNTYVWIWGIEKDDARKEEIINHFLINKKANA